MKPEEIISLEIEGKTRSFIAKDIPIKIGDKTIDKEGAVYLANDAQAVEALTKDKQLTLIPYIKPFQP